MSYTVHNIPFWLRPFVFIFSWIGGFFFYFLNAFFRLVCRIEYEGKEHLDSCPNHIFSVWHDSVNLFFIVHKYFHKPNIFITFPLLYMTPIHVMKKLVGVKELAFGGSGYGGKAALEKVINRLKQGWSTFITPDGPYGPLKHIKKGVLLMSYHSKTPIIPISFHLSKEYRIPTWDRKRYPIPFCKITVIYRAPIWVTDENFDHYRSILKSEMNDLKE